VVIGGVPSDRITFIRGGFSALLFFSLRGESARAGADEPAYCGVVFSSVVEEVVVVPLSPPAPPECFTQGNAP